MHEHDNAINIRMSFIKKRQPCKNGRQDLIKPEEMLLGGCQKRLTRELISKYVVIYKIIIQYCAGNAFEELVL